MAHVECSHDFLNPKKKQIKSWDKRFSKAGPKPRNKTSPGAEGAFAL